MTEVSVRWKTIATVGFTHSVGSNVNRAAHGGVCHLQARITKTGLVGRKVNSNGLHQEVGEPFAIDEEVLANWERIAKP